MTTTDGSTPLPGRTPMWRRIVNEANNLSGLDCTNHLDAFTAFLEPVMVGVDPNALRATLAKPFGKGGISTCALVASGIHFMAGYDAPDLQAPYKWGDAVARCVRYLKADGVWVDAKPDLRPDPGACIVIGCHGKTEALGGIEHVMTVVGREWDGGNEVLTTVDGGQVDSKGLQAIRTVKRRFAIRHKQLWVVTMDGDRDSAQGRRILGWGTPHD